MAQAVKDKPAGKPYELLPEVPEAPRGIPYGEFRQNPKDVKERSKDTWDLSIETGLPTTVVEPNYQTLKQEQGLLDTRISEVKKQGRQQGPQLKAWSPGLWERIKLYFYKAPPPGGWDRSDKPLRTAGKLGLVAAADAASGLALTLPDILAQNLTGTPTIGEATAEALGIERTVREKNQGELVSYMTSLVTAGKLMGLATQRLAAGEATRAVVHGVGTFAGREAVAQGVEKVTTGKPVSKEEIAIQGAWGGLFGFIEAGVGRVIRWNNIRKATRDFPILNKIPKSLLTKMDEAAAAKAGGMAKGAWWKTYGKDIGQFQRLWVKAHGVTALPGTSSAAYSARPLQVKNAIARYDNAINIAKARGDYEAVAGFQAMRQMELRDLAKQVEAEEPLVGIGKEAPAKAAEAKPPAKTPAVAQPTPEAAEGEAIFTEEEEQWLGFFRQSSEKIQRAEKTPGREMTPEEVKLFDEDFEAFSKSRGYTDADIKAFKDHMDLVTEGHAMGFTDNLLSSIERQIGQRLEAERATEELDLDRQFRQKAAEGEKVTKKPTLRLSHAREAGFVDLTPLAEAGVQVKQFSDKAGKGIVRFGGLTPEVRQTFIEWEEQMRELPKVIAKEMVDKYGHLTPKQELALQQHIEQPKKYPDVPEELKPFVDEIKKDNAESGARLEELGYPADWPNTYLERLEKALAKAEAKETPDLIKIASLQEAIEEGKDLEYLHHFYNKTPAGKRIWARFRKSISKKPRGLLGREIPTLEKAREMGLDPAALAVSMTHMKYEVARAEETTRLVEAINNNPNLSLPEKDAPKDWVRLDERMFPASVQHQAWVEEGKPRHKKLFRKYPLPIAEGLQELTYARNASSLERAYDKLNFGLKMIGFYNPLVMSKNDAAQLWRAAGAKGALPLLMPQIGARGIEAPRAVQIWMDKGPEYEKLRKAGLFNNVVSYTQPATEIAQSMVDGIRKDFGEKAAEVAKKAFNPANWVKALRIANDKTTWNLDEIMRIAAYESVKNSKMLAGMTDFEKIEWVNDAMVNYGKLPKATKRALGKALFVPTYRIGNFKFFFDEMNRVYQGDWNHAVPILRTVGYKAFIKYGLPPIIAAAIYYKTGEERDVRTEKGYRVVINNPKTGTDTVYALSDPLLEGAKLTQRTLRHTVGLNLAPLPSLVIRAMNGPRRRDSRDPFGEFFKLGTPIYRDIVNWTDPDTTVPQKILTQLAIAFAYTRRARVEEKDKIVTSLAKTLSIWTDWKEQAADIKTMVSGRSYYLGPGGKFGRLLRQYNMEQDIDQNETDRRLDSMIATGKYKEAVELMMDTERYATGEGITGRILSHKAPIFKYMDGMGTEDRQAFQQWLVDNNHYSKHEVQKLAEALEETRDRMQKDVGAIQKEVRR